MVEQHPASTDTCHEQERSPLEQALTASNTRDNFAFQHMILCQVGLPRKRIEGDSFLRESGKAWINIQAGVIDEGDGPIKQPIPYGVTPRLALAYISTMAVKTQSREIVVGHNAGEFLRKIGVVPENQEKIPGKRYGTLRTQMHALAACRLQLGFKGRTYNGSPIHRFDAWAEKPDSRQNNLWPGIILLGADYFQSLLDNAVPLDSWALHRLKGSALALDIYTWLANRLHSINKPYYLPWLPLQQQFGQEYVGKFGATNFRNDFKDALKSVLEVYQTANVSLDTKRGGIILKCSPPPVSFD